MNSNTLTSLCLAVLLAALAAGGAEAVEITFQVRMAYQVELGNFDPGSDFVDVAGTLQRLGRQPAHASGRCRRRHDLRGHCRRLHPVRARSNTSSASTAQWDGTEEFPGVGNNRVYTVPASGDTILVWYNDYAPTGRRRAPLVERRGLLRDPRAQLQRQRRRRDRRPAGPDREARLPQRRRPGHRRRPRHHRHLAHAHQRLARATTATTPSTTARSTPTTGPWPTSRRSSPRPTRAASRSSSTTS